jgi:hypothetical protein
MTPRHEREVGGVGCGVREQHTEHYPGVPVIQGQAGSHGDNMTPNHAYRMA